MNKLLNIAKVGVSIAGLLSNAIFAEEAVLNEQLAIGKKIYERSFGRGCGACHDIASNPQLVELISEGSLNFTDFSDTVIYGKNGMPKAEAAIMAVGPVKKSGYTPDQAIEAIYNYLKFLGNEEAINPEENNSIPSDQPSVDKENAIILNPDLSFTIPVIKFVDSHGDEYYFKVDFSYKPDGNTMLFEPVKITELE